MSETPIEAGKQYFEISDPDPVLNPGKIEVVELFSYGNPHSYAFEPIINPWIDKLPQDVNFLRIPVVPNPNFEMHGRLFVTLEIMGAEHKIRAAVFNAIQNERKLLRNPNEMADFVATKDVDRNKFLEKFNSYAVSNRFSQYKAKSIRYGANSVPSLVVNGKYRFDPESAGGYNESLRVADALIEKERKART